MKKVYYPLLAALLSAGPIWAQTGPLVLVGPPEYYMKGLSANGEWAYGAYVPGNSSYGFRWNVKNNKIEMLSNGNRTCEPSGIANNGTVVGFFSDDQLLPNGANIHNEGYWDGKWHTVDMPEGAPVLDPDDGGSTKSVSNNVAGISINGQYMAGDSKGDKAIVWKDGKILWTAHYPNGGFDRGYCVSNDGSMIGGWAYRNQNDQERRPVIYLKDGSVVDLPVGERLSPIVHPFQNCSRFTSNDRYALYWGNYLEGEPTADNPSGVRCYTAYDTQKKEVITTPPYTPNPGGIHWYAINANGTMVGYEVGSFKETNEDGTVDGDSTYLFMWKDGKHVDLYKYLESKGVDFKSLPNFSSIDTNGMGISDDEKTFTLRYIGTDYGSYPLIIRIDENVTSRPPVQLTASRVQGATGVLLEWSAPLAGEKGVKSYKLYRDGKALADVDAQTLRYVDSDVKLGESHTYTATAVYASVESDVCDAASITLNEIQPKAPTNLFSRQKGQSQLLLQWNAPKSNLTTKNYYDDENDEITGFGGGANDFEAAVCFPTDELSLYKGQKLSAVQFYPMTEQNSWTVNLYTHDNATGETKLFYTQPVTQKLALGAANKVVLTTPQDLPADKDLYVAIAIDARDDADYNILGEVNGMTTPGYTDLIRLTANGEAFYSTYNKAAESGYTSADTWAIDAILTSGNESADIDHVASYDVLVDGEKVGTTSDLTLTTDNLATGSHTVGIVANYADGRKSPATEKSVNVEENENYYAAINQLNITPKGEEGATFSWEAPKNNDGHVVTYAYGAFKRAMSTNSDAYWNLLARAEYLPKWFKSYEGYNITAGRFYPCCDAIYTLILYADGTKVAEKEVQSYTTNQWNEVKFDQPIPVKEGVTYTFDVDCYDVEEGGTPLPIDDGGTADGYSNLFSQDGGQSFSTLKYNNDYEGNWMIGLKLDNGNEQPVPELQGYKVVIDTRNSYAVDKNATSYDYKPATIDSKNHRVRVDAIYDVKGTVKGNTLYFTFAATGINDATMSQLEVSRNGSVIEVTGADVQGLTLVSADGKQVAKANGNTLNVTTAAAGAYVLRVQMAGGEVKSQKILVK